MLLPDQLVAFAEHRLDARAAIGQRRELVTDAADMDVDAAVEARQRSSKPLLRQLVLAHCMTRRGAPALRAD